MDDFYDRLTPFYHLIFPDWDDSMDRQGRELSELIRAKWPGAVSVLDYDKEERGKNILKPYGIRHEGGSRYLGFQVWDFEGDHYDLTLFLIEEDQASKKAVTHTLHSRYYAVGTAKLLSLMRAAGFENPERLDGVYYQPVFIGGKSRSG